MTTTLTTDCRALLAACRAQPDEDTPRLELADALQEGGDDARAELIRVQVELAKGAKWYKPTCSREEGKHYVFCGHGDIEAVACADCWKAERARESALTSANPDWLPPCPSCQNGTPEAIVTYYDVGGEHCTTCDDKKRISTHVRGLTVLTVTTLGTLFEQCPSCKGTGEWEDAQFRDMVTTCKRCAGKKWQLTPYARELRDRFPFVSEVWCGDRKPYHNGHGYCWYNGARREPHGSDPDADLPMWLFKMLDEKRERWVSFSTPDLASRALAAAVARAVYDGARSDNGVSLTGV